ncbi:kelch-like protein 21 isoform X2 [Dreissena polymorpha]|uniref:BTB domain-containing protein n=1 Tax=Dreissena polymorpha TaxID=45954 RepID=A0A9D4DKB8_DREPO|nr:kelch-like protein 21 isoform X2 [Dreissena polymorpha]KAH3751232.1 hypothetical protein DPMN_185784 [Dreissena polymorpha]
MENNSKSDVSNLCNLQEHLYNQALGNSELCDVTISFGSKEMRAHWCVLVQCPYFRAMYNVGMKEKREGKIHISEGTEHAIRSAIGYIYTGKVSLEYTLVEDLLHAADYFQINSLTDLCNNFLIKLEWCPDNCIEIYFLAKNYNLELFNNLMHYIANNLIVVIEEPKNVKHISTEMMNEISLVAVAESIEQEVIFLFYRKWLNYDVVGRKMAFEELFCSLNLEDTTHIFFESLACDFIQNFRPCRDFYQKTRQALLRYQLKPRHNVEDTLLVIADHIGHSSDRSSLFLCAYVKDINRWAFITSVPSSIDHSHDDEILIGVDENNHCVYTCNNHIWNYGGDFSSTNLKLHINKYDLKTRIWTVEKYNLPMQKSREIDVKCISFVANRLCVLLTPLNSWGEPKHVTLLVYNGQDICDETVILKLSRHFTNVVSVKTCIVKNRYLVIMVTILNNHGTEKQVKVVIKDVHTKKLKRHKMIPQAMPDNMSIFDTEELVCDTFDGVLMTKVDSDNYKFLNVENGQVSSRNGKIIPRHFLSDEDADNANVDDEEFESYLRTGNGLNSLSVFDDRTDTFSMFDFVSGDVHKVPILQYRVVSQCIIHVPLSSDLLRCSVDCKQCLYELM